MTRAFMILALCVAGASCGGPQQRSSSPAPYERPAKVQPARLVAPPCLAWATCELACPEGANLQRDETKRALYCALDGAPDGPYTRWHSTGGKALAAHFVNGEKHGPITGWYADGTKMLQGQKARGRAHGPWRNWHPNGQLAAESIWTDDMWVSGRCWRATGERCPIDHLCQNGPCE